jgi:hypothetical protein
MENVKPIAMFLQPDDRSTSWTVVDWDSGQARPIALDDQYKIANGLSLAPQVPTEVQSDFGMVKMTFLYGWLYYPFYTVSEHLASMALEFALIKRFPQNERDGLKSLLKRAINRGLVRDDGFPSLPKIQEAGRQYADDIEAITGVWPQPSTDRFVDALLDSIPKLRNESSHPSDHWIVPPGDALSSLRIVVEIINQLWQESSAGS